MIYISLGKSAIICRNIGKQKIDEIKESHEDLPNTPTNTNTTPINKLKWKCCKSKSTIGQESWTPPIDAPISNQASIEASTTCGPLKLNETTYINSMVNPYISSRPFLPTRYLGTGTRCQRHLTNMHKYGIIAMARSKYLTM